MPDSILTDKIIYRGLLLDLRNFILQLIFCPVCQKNRSGLHAAGIHMANTVLFLIRSGIFMFPDYVVPVIINRCTGYHTGLAVSIHRQFI